MRFRAKSAQRFSEQTIRRGIRITSRSVARCCAYNRSFVVRSGNPETRRARPKCNARARADVRGDVRVNDDRKHRRDYVVMRTVHRRQRVKIQNGHERTPFNVQVKHVFGVIRRRLARSVRCRVMVQCSFAVECNGALTVFVGRDSVCERKPHVKITVSPFVYR